MSSYISFPDNATPDQKAAVLLGAALLLGYMLFEDKGVAIILSSQICIFFVYIYYNRSTCSTPFWHSQHNLLFFLTDFGIRFTSCKL